MGDPTRFYLAGRYSRREELAGVRDVIEGFGGVVTSRWLDGDHQVDDEGVPIGEDGAALVEDGHVDGHARAAALRASFATDDVEDVARADVLIVFTEPPRSSTSRGGRHVELGLGLGLRKKVLVVGPRENVFCWLPVVEHFPSWASAAIRVARIVKVGV